MFNQPLRTLSLTAALALVTTAGWAQSTSSAQPVKRIGVTPQDSHEAVQKATPNATATLVRTEPSTSEQARKKTPADPSSAKSEQATPSKPELNQRANTASNPSNVSNKTTGTVTNTTTPSAAMGITGTFPGDKPTSGEGHSERDGMPGKNSSTK